MRKIDLDEAHELMSRALCELYSFCKQNGLTCYLIGGTLLGAIRHKGFIPWDFDIDVCMPRPDIEKLIELTITNKPIGLSERYVIADYRNGTCWPFPRMFDTRTWFKRTYADDEYGGSHLWIDIIPIDGLPDELEDTEKLIKSVQHNTRMLRRQHARPFTGITKFIALRRTLARILLRIPGDKWIQKRFEKIKQSSNYENSKYVGALLAAKYDASGERMLKEEFCIPYEVEFEGMTFETFSCWPTYLSGIYGDYMTIPPENERETVSFGQIFLCEEGEIAPTGLRKLHEKEVL